jgi:hypothetical protein
MSALWKVCLHNKDFGTEGLEENVFRFGFGELARIAFG